MKFTVSSASMKAHLKTIALVVPSSPLFPILSEVHCRLQSGKLTLTGFDGQNMISRTMEVESKDKGVFMIPCKDLQRILSLLPEQPITLEIDPKTFKVTLITDSGKYQFVSQNAEDFPQIKQKEETDIWKLDISAIRLQEIFSRVAWSMATDDLRPSMVGLFFDFSDKLVTAATNGQTLSVLELDEYASENKFPYSAIVVRSGVMLLKSIVPLTDVVMELSFTSSYLKISFNETDVIIRLADERFPDYRAAIPNIDNMPFKAEFNKISLIASLRRVLLFTELDRMVVFSFGESSVLQADNSHNQESGREQLADVTYEGEALEIAFPGSYLLELLESFDEEYIAFRLHAANRAVIITPLESFSHTTLIMPLLKKYDSGAI